MEIRIVRTEEEAKYAAYRWAAREGADPAQMGAYGANIVKEQPLTEDFFIDSLRHFHGVTSRGRHQWKEGAQEMWRRHAEWSIETVKHLAVLNAGGVAGCAALLATTRPLNEPALRLGVVIFSLGLICAVLTFWLGAYAYSKRAREHDERAAECARATNWDEYVEACRKYEDPGKKWTDTAIFTGWTSAGTSLLGAFAIVVSVWSVPAPPASLVQPSDPPQTIR